MTIYERLSQVYDLGWGGFAEQYRGLVDRILVECGIKEARILDLACGTGILAMSLARQGHIVRGIDVSPKMIAVARSKTGGMPYVSFEVGDMTKFVVRGEFDLVTCTFDSVNYVLNIDDVEAMFVRVAASLEKAGRFVFDSNTRQLYVSIGTGTEKKELGGQSFVHKWSYNRLRNEATTTFEFADGSKEIHRQRPYDLSELSPVLGRAGLRAVETWSRFDRSPYDALSARLFCVAEKNS
jgi:ubiquinone/menaquinone biosynthesis C-methylase UbiE